LIGWDSDIAPSFSARKGRIFRCTSATISGTLLNLVATAKVRLKQKRAVQALSKQAFTPPFAAAVVFRKGWEQFSRR
jgi:hypothetical protein